MYRCILRNNGKQDVIFEVDEDYQFWVLVDYLHSVGVFDKDIEIVEKVPARVFAPEQEPVKESTESATMFIATECRGALGKLSRTATEIEKIRAVNALRTKQKDRWKDTKNEAKEALKTKRKRKMVFKRTIADEKISFNWIPAYGEPVVLGSHKKVKTVLRKKKNFKKALTGMPEVVREVKVRSRMRQEFKLDCYLCEGKMILKGGRTGVFYGCINYENSGCKATISATPTGVPDILQYNELRS